MLRWLAVDKHACNNRTEAGAIDRVTVSLSRPPYPTPPPRFIGWILSMTRCRSTIHTPVPGDGLLRWFPHATRWGENRAGETSVLRVSTGGWAPFTLCFCCCTRQRLQKQATGKGELRDRGSFVAKSVSDWVGLWASPWNVCFIHDVFTSAFSFRLL